MKGKLALSLMIMLVLGFISFPSYAQSSSNEQRLIGTWVDHEGGIWIFNANGTYSSGGETGRYGATSSKMFIIMGGDNLVMDYSISTDGRTLILSWGGMSPFGILLTKRN
jgi:hypothetical protein